MARPRMTSSALLIRASRISVASASSSDSRRDRTSCRSCSASCPVMAAQRRAERPGVERVDPVQAAADPDDLPAEVADQRGVVRLGVAEDEHLGAERHRPGDQPLHQRGLAGAGLAEDEHPGVGDQPGAQPGQRVEARRPRPTAGAARPGCRRPGCRCRPRTGTGRTAGWWWPGTPGRGRRARPGRRRGSSIPTPEPAVRRRQRQAAAPRACRDGRACRMESGAGGRACRTRLAA